jgi:serine/threonine protein kinase
MQPPHLLSEQEFVHQRYRINKIIGQGGMGAVYEAIDERLGNRVALKQMIVNGDSYAQAFQREARLLAGLRHPCLPKVSDYFVDGDNQFLVMEYIPGDDLAALRSKRSQPFAIDEVLRWAEQILGALNFLHHQNPPIIHRDIKPQNMKVTPDDDIVLLDFGLAKGSANQALTNQSIFGYTPTYAPLEQIHGSGTTVSSDIYSLGATLYQLLSDVEPVDALKRVSAIVTSQPDPIRPAHEYNRALHPAYSAWLAKAMAIDPAQRYASANEMLQALQQINKHPSSPIPPTLIAPPQAGPAGYHHSTPPQAGAGGYYQPTPPQAGPAGYHQPTPPQAGAGGYYQPTPAQWQQAPTPALKKSSMPWLIAGIAAFLLLIGVIGGAALWFLGGDGGEQTASRSQTSQGNGAGGENDPRATRTPRPSRTPAVNPSPNEGVEATEAQATMVPIPSPEPSPAGPQYGQLSDQYPVSVSASGYAPAGFDSAQNRISYEPERATDGNPETAWRVEGNGRNHYLQLDFAQPILVEELLILPGYAKIDPYDGTDRFWQNRRVRRARLEFSDGSQLEVQFADVRDMQLIAFGPIETSSIRIVILETTELRVESDRDFTPISEIVVRGKARL